MKEYLLAVVSGERHGLVPFFLKMLLWLCSLLYGAGLAAIKFFYCLGLLPQKRLPRPVVSVGNITLGGVGKTPLVMAVAEYLWGRGLRPAILLRGYMSTRTSEWRGKAGAASDEAQMIQELLPQVPVGVGRDRWQSAQSILKKYPVDVFILDDGFQQWGLHRDLDMVVVDSVRLFGNGHLLPRGFLREPKKALSRADILVLTKTEPVNHKLRSARQELVGINPQALVVETIHQPLNLTRLPDGEVASLSMLGNRRAAMLSSIGDPQSLVKTLHRLGVEVVDRFAFLDHHVYTAADVEGVARACQRAKLNMVITTAKDAVKLKKFISCFGPDIEVWVLNIRLTIVKGQDEFFSRVDSLLQH